MKAQPTMTEAEEAEWMKRRGAWPERLDDAAFAERVRLARERRGWSHEEVASALDVTAKHVARSEQASGQGKDWATVCRWANALGVRVGWLATGAGEMWQPGRAP